MKFRDNVAPWLLFILAICMGMNIYTFNIFQLNAFNISAFFLTLSGLNQGSTMNKNLKMVSMLFKKINIGIGIIMLVLSAFASGFKYYNIVEFCVNSIDTNALLLLGIAVTLWSFKLSDHKNLNDDNNYNKKIQNLKEQYLNEKEKRLDLYNKLKIMRNTNEQLTIALKEAQSVIEIKLQEERNQ